MPGQPVGATEPGFEDLPILRVARAMFARRDFDQALRQFDEAVRRSPRSVRARIDAARAHGFRYRTGRAVALLDEAVGLAPGSAQAHHLAGETARMLGLADRAVRHFERAAALAGDRVPTWVELAALLERSHQLDRAGEAIDRALRLAPGWPPALVLRARVLRRQARTDEAEATLRDLLARADLDPELAAEAWGDLALLLDGRDDCPGAWDAIGRCKAIQLGRDEPERQASAFVDARFDRLLAALTPEHLGRWSADPPATDGPPLAFLTGFPRSGTTLLERVLDAHPGLVSSEERDVLSADVFPALGGGRAVEREVIDILEDLDPADRARARRRYLAGIEGTLMEPVGGRVHLDKNPALTPMLPVVARLFPEARLLIALRDPRDVVLSCYLRYLPLNPVSVHFLTPERAARRFARDLSAWLALRGMLRNPWVEVRYEELVDDLPGQARRAVDFLGLGWDDAVLAYRDRQAEKPVLSPTYEAVSRPVYRTAVGRWRRYAGPLAPALEILAPLVESLGFD